MYWFYSIDSIRKIRWDSIWRMFVYCNLVEQEEDILLNVELLIPLK